MTQNLYTAPIRSVPQEYVADTHDVGTFPRGICPDQHTAQENITAYLHERTRTVLRRDTRRPAVMLSGGIDSILTAAVLAQHRPDAVAVTVDFPVHSGAGDTGAGDTLDHATESAEVTTARAVAEALGLEHHVVSLGEYEITRAAEWVMDLLTDPDRHIQMWQTVAATQLALALTPEQVRGNDGGVSGAGAGVDKLILRQVAQQHGVPAMLTTAAKSPMQVSSGGVAGLVRTARAELAADRSHTHYTDPAAEPLEHTVARLWLDNIRMARGSR